MRYWTVYIYCLPKSLCVSWRNWPTDEITFCDVRDDSSTINDFTLESAVLSRKSTLFAGMFRFFCAAIHQPLSRRRKSYNSNTTLITLCSVRDMSTFRPSMRLIFSHDAVIRRGLPVPVYRKHLRFFFRCSSEPPGCWRESIVNFLLAMHASSSFFVSLVFVNISSFYFIFLHCVT